MPTPELILAGKSALITGSSQGLGLVAAERLAEAGAHIVLNGFAEPGRMDAIQHDLGQRFGVRTLYCDADLRDAAQIESMMAQAAAAFGAIDVLVNNAVVRHAAPIERFTPAEWDEALAVNLTSAFHTIRMALPRMRAKQWGRIINVSSIYGVRGAANRVGYVTTKTALIGLTRAVALETAGENITCNAICPGTTRTPVHEARLHDLIAEGVSAAEAEQELLTGKQPTGRLIAPEHVAALMVFLCGPESHAITGAVLPIDGAWSAG
jgi:3-hydroxybutyrate dehydrogenase